MSNRHHFISVITAYLTVLSSGERYTVFSLYHKPNTQYSDSTAGTESVAAEINIQNYVQPICIAVS